MPQYILSRLLQAFPLLFFVLLINFTLIHAAPGTPLSLFVGQQGASPEFLERIQTEFALDQPLYVQFAAYLTNIASLNLGYSIRYREEVLTVIMSRMPATLLLAAAGIVVSSIAGVLLGAVAGSRTSRSADGILNLASLAGQSVPVFWLGQLLLLLFASVLGWFPTQGMESMRNPATGFARVLDILHHLALPALAYSLFELTLIFRLTRVKMREVLRMDYILTARAKGVRRTATIYRHALPNAFLPVLTLIGFNFGYTLSGVVLVENVFAWPGIGRLINEAIFSRDYPLLLGLFTVGSVMVIVATLVTDIVAALLDPRIRLAPERRAAS